MTNTSIYDGLKHIRLVHYTLVIVSFTVFYIVVSVWSDSPELLAEFEKFETAVERIQSDDLFFLMLLPKKWHQAKIGKLIDDINKIIEPENNRRVQVKNQHFIPILKKITKLQKVDDILVRWPDIQTSSIENLRNSIENREWQIEKISQVGVDRSTKLKINEWIRKNIKGKTDFLAKGTYYAKDLFILDLSLKKMIGVKKKEVSISLGMDHMFLSTEENSLPVKIGMLKEEFFLSGETENENVRMPQGWFKKRENYPRIYTHWDEIKHKTISEAKQSLKEKMTERLKGRSTNMLGIRISGPDIGYMGPLAIIIILLYLVNYEYYLYGLLKNRIVRIKENENLNFALPWIGVMQTNLSLFTTFITISLFPAIAVLFAIWRVLGAYVLDMKIIAAIVKVKDLPDSQPSRVSDY
ncbi:MAG: hypothetical protein [Olavius algarvensis Delta 4 endosymbiont]|nr:MAG: hypothetical protein [Olavius algarvensis Delta 4 endosymbiont]